MTLDYLLERLDGVRKTSKGWSARCPAHQDRSPSLSVHAGERGVLLHCWAGCETASICAALGITLAELFYDEAAGRRPSRSHTPRRPTKREVTERLEYALWSAAIVWEFYGLRVLDAAKGLDAAGWDAADFDRAVKAVTKGYDALRVADRLHSLAFRLRIELLALTAAKDGEHGRVSSAA